MCRQWGYQHYVGPSGTRFGFLKQGLGFESCEWKKKMIEKGDSLKVVSQFPVRRLVISESGGCEGLHQMVRPSA